MVFNSLIFLVFFAVFWVGYLLLRGRGRLMWCLAASYFFYGWWDWRFLSLILLSTLVDYTVGLRLAVTDSPEVRRRYLWVSLGLNLGLLGVFKYFNFFADSLLDFMALFGMSPSVTFINIVLPVGISFYTFQTLSYSIDVYRRRLEAERSLLTFATFVSFFPQLVAGPIVRAADLLPQLREDRPFNWDNVVSGGALVVLGYFKKVAIADTLAIVVDPAFANPGSYTALNLIIVVVFYAFQIYCDFSGYSDIAIGLARILGFEFPLNFNKPYFSQDFSEFWTRWHVSLSSWLRDYLYIPLGGNRHGTFNTYRNLMITMLLGGLWHGAAWSFVFWGALHGGYLVVQRLLTQVRPLERLRLPAFVLSPFRVALVFTLTCFAWVFFRSATFADAWLILGRIAALGDLSFGNVQFRLQVAKGVLLIVSLVTGELLDEWIAWKQVPARQFAFRVAGVAVMLWYIALFGTFGGNQFVYFQF